MDELKPIAWFHVTKKGGYWISPIKQYPKDQPLYFSPPQREWQGLTDEEIREFELWLDDEEEKHGWNPPADIVKYLEAKLREKNHD